MVYSHIHFCLIGSGSTPEVNSSPHPDLADVIDVTLRVGDASVTVSGASATVRTALTQMLDAALRVVPKTDATGARP